MTRGELAQAGEIALGRRNAAGVADDGLDDDGGDGIGVRGKCGFDGVEIVVGQRQRQVRNLFGNAGRAGDAEGRHAGAGFDEKSVGVAVIAALEFDDEFAAGGGAGQADGRHGGLGAGADEAHLFDGGIAGHDALGEIGLGGRGCAEAGRVARRALDGFDHGRKGVAQNHRAPGAEVVDVAVAVGVVEIRALGALDEGRRAAHGAKGAHRRVDAAGKVALGALLEGPGNGCELIVWVQYRSTRAGPDPGGKNQDAAKLDPADEEPGRGSAAGQPVRRLFARRIAAGVVDADARQRHDRHDLQRHTEAYTKAVEEVVLRRRKMDQGRKDVLPSDAAAYQEQPGGECAQGRGPAFHQVA